MTLDLNNIPLGQVQTLATIRTFYFLLNAVVFQYTYKVDKNNPKPFDVIIHQRFEQGLSIF